jgi:hypothetical protein
VDGVAWAAFGGIVVEDSDDPVTLFGHAGDFAEDALGGVAGADEEESHDSAVGHRAGFFIDEPDEDAYAACEEDGEEGVEEKDGSGKAGDLGKFAGAGEGEGLPEAGRGIEQCQRDEGGGGETEHVSQADVAPLRGSAAVEAHGDPDGELDDEERGEEGKEELGGPVAGGEAEVEADGEREEEGETEEAGLECERGCGVGSGLPWPGGNWVEGWGYDW